MNKQDLIDAMAANSGITKTEARVALESLVDAMRSALKGGDTISLTGFGSFQVAERSARTARNPKTGETIKVDARKVVRFKPGSNLKEGL
ncbi:MAG TPA: HU family DNA-binding protein [Bacteroidales bacterium]|jgi:DNA-binding protein HU-beta|nr:HU family DNA-binding protein [Bacteroidales bacterium]